MSCPVYNSIYEGIQSISCPTPDLDPLNVFSSTGKKWSIEQMSDPVAVRTLIARFVTETCQAARKRERDRLIKDEEESKREADIAAARTLAAALILQPSPRKPRPPQPPPRAPSQTFQRIPSSSNPRDLGPAVIASVDTAEQAAVRYAAKARADQKQKSQLENPFADDEDDGGHVKAATVVVQAERVRVSTRVMGREEPSLPPKVSSKDCGHDNNDDDEDDDIEDNEYIDEEFECDQQDDEAETDVTWGAPSTEEKQLIREVKIVTIQNGESKRPKVFGGERSRSSGNPFGDSDSDD